MQEAGDISERVASGYRLFASSFTYSKIRREVESAQAEFLARIHKTFVDIQGQLLGIPVATVVVAIAAIGMSGHICGKGGRVLISVHVGTFY